MKKVRGVWADREDLNSLQNIRKEWARLLYKETTIYT
ncbi:hypothetical protein NUACC26_047830 [Scytonema sp. NUACC26]